jgi:hypothetical protein
VITTESLVDAGVAKRQTASVYLKALAVSSILDEKKFGRDKLFVHSRFLRLLTRDDATFNMADFAATHLKELLPTDPSDICSLSGGVGEREAYGVGGGGTRRWVACSKP